MKYSIDLIFLWNAQDTLFIYGDLYGGAKLVGELFRLRYIVTTSYSHFSIRCWRF